MRLGKGRLVADRLGVEEREVGGLDLATTDLVNARSLLEKKAKALKLIDAVVNISTSQTLKGPEGVPLRSTLTLSLRSGS